MKSRFLGPAFIALLMLALAGCSKPSSAVVDPSSVEKSFDSADAAVKAAATRAANAIKSADYNVAMAELLKLAADPNLTGPQRQAVTDALDQLRKATADGTKEASREASNAVGEAQKTLGK